jgi:hypothetical protein
MRDSSVRTGMNDINDIMDSMIFSETLAMAIPLNVGSRNPKRGISETGASSKFACASGFLSRPLNLP